MSQINNSYERLQNVKYTLYSDFQMTASQTFDASNVLDTQIEYDSDDICVFGASYIVDTKNIFATIPNTSELLFRIQAKQHISKDELKQNQYDLDRYFVIVSVEKAIQNDTRNVVKIEYMDVYSYSLYNTYISKGYKNSSIADIVKDVLNNVIPKSLNKKYNAEMFKQLAFYDALDNTYESIVTPGNISFLKFLKQREYMDGMNILNARNAFRVHDADTLFDKARTYSFADAIELNTKPNHPHYIKEVSVQTVDSINTAYYTPNALAYSFTETDKKLQFSVVDQMKIKSKLTTNEVLHNTSDNIGFKLSEYNHQNNLSVYSKLYKQKLLHGTVLEVTISGNFYLFDLYNVIKVKIGNVVPELNQVNLQHSGTYTIIKVIDKINGLDFHQFLTLAKTGIEY